MSPARILVVDDERFFREAIRDVLGPEGYDLVFASDGTSALEESADPSLGVVILDLQLPDLHGLEVFRRLRATRPDLRVIILSAHTDQEYVLEALRLGACDYLAKPIHGEELSLAVGRAAENHAVAASRERLRTRLGELERGLVALRERAREPEADPAQLLEAAVALLADLVGAGRTSLLVPDGRAQELRVAAAQGGKVPTAEMDAVPIGEGIAGRVWARAEPALVSDLDQDERFAGLGHAGRYQTPSFAIAPLQAAGGGALGVLCASDPRQGGSFDEDDLSLVKIFAGELAQLIEATRAPRPSLTGQAEATDHGASLARAICEAVTAEIEPARILEAVLRPVAEQLDAAPVALFLTAPAGDELVREAQWDSGRADDRQRLLAPAGLTGAVLETGRLVATGDPSTHPRFDPEVDTARDGEVRPFLCGPLRFRNKTLGVFRVFPSRAEDAQPEVGEVLCAALSAAVRNVLLYRSLLQTIEEVAVARRQARPQPAEPASGEALRADVPTGWPAGSNEPPRSP